MIHNLSLFLFLLLFTESSNFKFVGAQDGDSVTLLSSARRKKRTSSRKPHILHRGNSGSQKKLIHEPGKQNCNNACWHFS